MNSDSTILTNVNTDETRVQSYRFIMANKLLAYKYIINIGSPLTSNKALVLLMVKVDKLFTH